jgi:Zn-dependent membrane protease YugP
MFFDPLYILMILPVFLFSLYAQFKVKSSFSRFSKFNVSGGSTGKDVARIILEKNGINDIRVEETHGFLSDHYSPTQKVLKLSSNVFNSSSISALGVAAHEAGHAIQHIQGFFIMRLWMSFAKPISIISNAALWMIFIGFIINILNLALIGVILFLGFVIFQIITLPLEFDASNRAKKMLFEYGLISKNEQEGVNEVLNAAAMTYVAAAAVSVTQLLYFLVRLGIFGRRD